MAKLVPIAKLGGLPGYIEMGTVTTVEPAEQAFAEITGVPGDQVFNLGVPRGYPGYNATGAVEDQEALADYVNETAGPNPFRGALSSTFARPMAKAGAVLADLFTSDASRLAIWREDYGSDTAHWLGRHIGGNMWDCYELRAIVSSVSGHVTTQLQHNEIRLSETSLDDTDDSIVFTGSAWEYTIDAGAYGGGYRRNFGSAGTAGQTMDWTTPADSDRVALRLFVTTNGGYGRVLIDGDPTRATALPTAQDEVDGGRLDPAALVANGGNLEPTDRLVNNYAPVEGVDKDKVVTLATGLPTGTKTVTLEAIEQRPIASTGNRLYVGGVSYSGANSTPAGVEPVERLFGASSVWEYALHAYTPEPSTWVGNSHGYDQDDSVTIYADGELLNLADGEVVGADKIIVTRRSTLLDPNDGVTETGKASVTYVIAAAGLRVEWQIGWIIAGTLGGPSYTAMMPRDPAFIWSKNVGLALPEAAIDNDGLFKSNAAADTMLTWQDSSEFASVMMLPNSEQDQRGFLTDVKLAVEDRADGTMKKVYAQRADASAPETFAAGAVMRGGATYSTARFADPGSILSAL